MIVSFIAGSSTAQRRAGGENQLYIWAAVLLCVSGAGLAFAYFSMNVSAAFASQRVFDVVDTRDGGVAAALGNNADFVPTPESEQIDGLRNQRVPTGIVSFFRWSIVLCSVGFVKNCVGYQLVKFEAARRALSCSVAIGLELGCVGRTVTVHKLRPFDWVVPSKRAAGLGCRERAARRFRRDNPRGVPCSFARKSLSGSFTAVIES